MSTTSVSASCDSLQLRESEVTMHIWRPLRLIRADLDKAAGGSAPSLELLTGFLFSGEHQYLSNGLPSDRIYPSAG